MSQVVLIDVGLSGKKAADETVCQTGLNIFCFLKAATDINKLKQIQDVNQQDRRN